MSKLTVELVKKSLLEKDEMKKVSAQKLQLSKHRKSGEVKNIKDPSLKMTKIKQVEVPKEEGKTSDKGGSSFIPQADFANKYTDKMPHGQGPAAGKGGSNQKSPKIASATSMKPNQETNLKAVKDSIKGTDDDGTQKAAALPAAKFASEYTDSMPHGNEALGSGNNEGGEGQSDPSVSKMAGGPTRAGGARNATRLGEIPKDKRAKEIGKHKDNMPMPSDAMKTIKFDKKTGNSHNVVESGVAVKLGGKVKAVFDIVDRNVLTKMVENYEKFGYNISLSRVTPSWKKDSKLMGLLREAVNAKYNFAPQTAMKLRKAALHRFHALTKGSYNDMYESRQNYIETVKSAFGKIENLAESKYLDGLELYECVARVKIEGVIADLEVITEATDHQMALRQVRNQIAEEYGFNSAIGHIIVDGKKYTPKKIVEYHVKKH